MTFRSLAELASRPELMEPPAVVVPPVGIAGRVALVTLGPKKGKSTTVAGMIAQASQRGVRCGLFTLDEAPEDSLQRLLRFRAQPELVYLKSIFDPDTLEEEVATLDIHFLALD